MPHLNQMLFTVTWTEHERQVFTGGAVPGYRSMGSLLPHRGFTLNTIDIPHWKVKRSSRCESNFCIGYFQDDDHACVCDTGRPDEPVLRFSTAAWTDFLSDLRNGFSAR